MRLAVFTNQFPARLTSFFGRDLRALVEAGFEPDVYPLYPLKPKLWDELPPWLNDDVLPRRRVRHINLSRAPGLAPLDGAALARWAGDTAKLAAAALRYGPACTAKTLYTAAKAWAWARSAPERYDHVLAYWANHSATAAYLFHRVRRPQVPLSVIVHARMDLYRQPAGLATKLRHADNIFVVCEYNRRYLARRYPRLYREIADRIHVHHLGLDLETFAYDPRPRPPARLLAVSRLEPLKGHHLLVEATDILRRRGLDVEVHLVGGSDDGYDAKLRALIARLGLEGRVVLHGWASEADVRRAMVGATLLVHPSIRPDAMPTVVKEAIAVGTPVVASDLAGIPEILDHGRCGVLVPPGDLAALADAIERLLRDPCERRRLAEAGRRHAERLFDVRRTGAAFAERLRATVRARGIA